MLLRLKVFRRLIDLKPWVALVVITMSGSACQRIVEIDIEEREPRLVVEGRIELIKEDPSGLQRIHLSTTDAFFSNRETPPATGAEVVVSDDQGGVFPFGETGPGLYEISDLVPTIGTEYTLRIEWQDDIYRSTARLMSVPSIDSLYFEFAEKSILTDSAGFRATINFVDPPGIANYYLWEQLVGEENVLSPDPGNVFNLIGKDEFYDGEVILGYQPNDEVVFHTGQHVMIRQIALSRNAFDYYFAMFEQNALGSGNPFSIPPASVRGNVQNLTRPGEVALGYFEAAEVSVAQAMVPAR